MIDLYRPSEAAERAAERAAAQAAKAEAAAARALATAAERRRLRRDRQREAAGLLGAGLTQTAVAQACGVSDRTIRNWLKLKWFQTAVTRARARAVRQAARDAAKERTRQNRNAARRYRRQNPALWADLKARRPELRSPFQQQPNPAPTPDQKPSRPGRLIRPSGGFNC